MVSLLEVALRGHSGGWVSADVSRPVCLPRRYCGRWGWVWRSVTASTQHHNAQLLLAAFISFYGMIVPAADKTAGPPDSSVLSLSRRGLLAGWLTLLANKYTTSQSWFEVMRPVCDPIWVYLHCALNCRCWEGVGCFAVFENRFLPPTEAEGYTSLPLRALDRFLSWSD
jgi:hypothetical protein